MTGAQATQLTLKPRYSIIKQLNTLDDTADNVQIFTHQRRLFRSAAAQFFLLFWRCIMALSARNLLKGKVKDVKKGMVMAEVVMEVAPGVEVVAAITTSSVERLNLAVGKDVEVVIKATSVMINA